MQREHEPLCFFPGFRCLTAPVPSYLTLTLQQTHYTARRVSPSPQMDMWLLLTLATTALKFTDIFSKQGKDTVDTTPA